MAVRGYDVNACLAIPFENAIFRESCLSREIGVGERFVIPRCRRFSSGVADGGVSYSAHERAYQTPRVEKDRRLEDDNIVSGRRKARAYAKRILLPQEYVLRYTVALSCSFRLPATKVWKDHCLVVGGASCGAQDSERGGKENVRVQPPRRREKELTKAPREFHKYSAKG